MVSRAMPISLDYSLALHSSAAPCGVEADALSALQARFSDAKKSLFQRIDSGELGFWALPDGAHVAASKALAGGIGEEITDVIVLGIGGSSLGGRAVYEALGGPPELRDGRRLHFPENSDPWRLARLIETLDPTRTLAVVISKSGGTSETAAMLLVIRKWLRDGGCEMAKHLVAVTDPETGGLRALAEKEGLKTLPIPQNVGGRFSVMTGVGLFPCALVGLDVAALCEGAKAARELCERDDLLANPAGILAALHVLHTDAGRNMTVFMPYSDPLRATAGWFVQLWAESLGKRFSKTGERIEVGATPIPAIGATDQHAQVQLFMEGPKDKFTWFVRVGERAQDLTMPREEGQNAYLGGRTMGDLNAAQQQATALALAKDGRPSLTLELPKVDAFHLGQLLFILEAATAFAGELVGIDAFDQPGVELGKRLAYGLFGREGFEKDAAEIQETLRSIPTRRVE